MSRLANLIRLTAALIAVPIAALIVAAPAAAEDRLALVIGNGGYRNVPTLANPVNDASLMTRTLREAGFRVTTVIEADRAAMERAVEGFRQDLRAAEPGALALFYFAGHGVRSDGFNYLLPLGVDIRAETDIAREGVAAEWVVERIDVAGVTSVMVLDACRNNPFDAGGPGTIPELGDGLARMTARNSNLIAYATGPGDVALDGTGGNSPYTAALARAIGTPGLDLEEIFTQVREQVTAETAGQQIPWDSSSLEGAVYVQPEPAQARAAPRGGPAGGAEGILRLAVTFSAGRWGGGGGARSCRALYVYDPLSIRELGARGHRLGAVNASGAVGLSLQASPGADGLELTIVPVSRTGSGRPVTAKLSEITPGREHAVHTHSRHPDMFGCGSMTVYLRRSG